MLMPSFMLQPAGRLSPLEAANAAGPELNAGPLPPSGSKLAQRSSTPPIKLCRAPRSSGQLNAPAQGLRVQYSAELNAHASPAYRVGNL